MTHSITCFQNVDMTLVCGFTGFFFVKPLSVQTGSCISEWRLTVCSDMSFSHIVLFLLFVSDAWNLANNVLRYVYTI